MLVIAQEEINATSQSISSTATSSKLETIFIGVLAFVLSMLFAWLILFV